MSFESSLLALPLESAVGLFLESPLPGGQLAQVSRRQPDIALPAGFCFSSDGEERVKKGDEEIVRLARDRFSDNEPIFTEDQVDQIFRAA